MRRRSCRPTYYFAFSSLFRKQKLKRSGTGKSFLLTRTNVVPYTVAYTHIYRQQKTVRWCTWGNWSLVVYAMLLVSKPPNQRFHGEWTPTKPKIPWRMNARNKEVFQFRFKFIIINDYKPVGLHRCFDKFLRRSLTSTRCIFFASAFARSERTIWSWRRPRCDVLAHRRLRQRHAGKIDRRFFVLVTETFGRSYRTSIFGRLLLEIRWTAASSWPLTTRLVGRVVRERCIRHRLFGEGLVSRLFVNLLDSLRAVVIATRFPVSLFLNKGKENFRKT